MHLLVRCEKLQRDRVRDIGMCVYQCFPQSLNYLYEIPKK